MLGESLISPSPIPTDPEHRDVPAIPKPKTNHFDWPDNLIDCIKTVMGTPCSTPSAPEFRFELSEEAMQHNLEVLDKYEFDLGKALDTQHNSPLGPGMEFCPTDVLHEIFGLHPPLWNRMEAILKKWQQMAVNENQRRRPSERPPRSTHLRQSQRCIVEVCSPKKAHQQRRQIQLQPSYPP